MIERRKLGKRAVSPADSELFREAVGPVRVIEAEPTVTIPPPAPEPSQRLADEAEALDSVRRTITIDGLMEPGEALAFRREHVPQRLLLRLRRGEFVVQDELDLHRMTASAARAGLRRFLAEAHRNGVACVRIVHGKGLRSEAGIPVLKPLVAEWLTQRADVLAFASAPAAQGGTGALLVLLARQRRQR